MTANDPPPGKIDLFYLNFEVFFKILHHLQVFFICVVKRKNFCQIKARERADMLVVGPTFLNR